MRPLTSEAMSEARDIRATEGDLAAQKFIHDFMTSPTDLERALADLRSAFAATGLGTMCRNIALGLNGDVTKRRWRYGFFAYVALVVALIVVSIFVR